MRREWARLYGQGPTDEWEPGREGPDDTVAGVSTALLTDLYELTMLRAARRAGIAQRRCAFEVFARSLPEGRRYGVLAGTARVLRAIEDFRFDEADLRYLARCGALDEEELAHLADYRFTGEVRGLREGELFFGGTPVLRVEGSFEDAVLLETVVLSILNHDSAVASAGARMITAARGRPCIEMGGRRVHEDAAIAAARAAWIVGFASTSNLAAGAHYRVPVAGTSAHAFTLLFDQERDAFAAQIAAQGPGTAVLVDTYDVETAVRTAVEIAGPQLGSVRVDSGNLPEQAHRIRALLDELGATSTRITVTGDLDEHRLEEIAPAPIDGYGVGTRLVTGSGHPTVGFVYKLVEREGADGRMHPVQKLSIGKQTVGGAKRAVRVLVDGKARLELALPGASGELDVVEALRTALGASAPESLEVRDLQVPLIVGGETQEPGTDPQLALRAREHHARVLPELGISADDGPDGPPAIPTAHTIEEAAALLA